ncbi:MAG: CD3072 family TudS-related putative desulfidase [Acidobacteriota bacterium]
MFTDARSKKLILVAHCVLNQNAISDGTADYPGSAKEAASLLLQSQLGIIQMPCPELHCLGLDRGDPHGAERPVVVENTRIRELMKQRPASRILRFLVRSLAYQMDEYLRHGFTIAGIVGINRSPSCGVNTTSTNNREVEGEGIFIEALRKELESRNIHTRWTGIKTSDPERSLLSIHALLSKHE